jgi:hypothetical protein
MTQKIIVAALLLLAPAVVEAGFIKIWQLKETAAAPVLVVGRVLDVQKIERVPDGSLSWKAETWSMTAEVQVLRSYAASGEPLTAERIQVHFLAYGPSVTQFVNGYPPPLPNIEAGRVLILPLKENQHPASDLWQLMSDSGVDAIIPARAEMTDSAPAPVTARAFLDREIANALSRGTSREVTAVTGYLAQQSEDLSGELMPLLEPVIKNDREHWAEVAANLIAAQGIPRPSVADLLAGKAKPKEWPGRESFLLAQAALQKLKASPETEALLIKTWVVEAPLHSWGSANSLLEYGDHPVTTDTLRQALHDDLAGSSYIAWTLARNGHQATLRDAVTRALKVVNRPASDYNDLQGAAALLRDYGSDQEVKQLAGLVRKYQRQDEKFYRVLWQFATYDGNPREARVLAVVLRDRRIVFGEVRYCDLAAGELAKAAGQQFGSGGATLKERDDAVSQAQAWLKTQGIFD